MYDVTITYTSVHVCRACVWKLLESTIACSADKLRRQANKAAQTDNIAADDIYNNINDTISFLQT